MAKTFKEFIQARALDDTKSLIVATRSVATHDRLAECLQHTIFGALTNPNTNLAMPADYIHDSALVGLNMAGEAIKKLEKTQPQVLKAYPEVPWNTLKRIRDICTHWEQNKHTPDDYASASERLKKEWARIEPHIAGLAIQNTQQEANTLFGRVRNGLQWFAAMRELSLDASDGIVRINQNPNIGAACTLLSGMPRAAMPLMIITMVSRDGINKAMDGITRTSVFYQKEHTQMYQSPALARLRAIRNKWAHFHDAHQEGFRDSFTETLESSQNMDRLRKFIQPTPPLFDDLPAVEAYAGKLAQRYENSLVGKQLRDPAKAAVLDDAVQWITSTLPEHQRKQTDAAVYGVSRMVRALPAAQAQEALNFLKTQDLSKPDQLEGAGSNQSPVVQTAMREFARTVLQFAPTCAKRA